jgi:CDP-6-deoxy-D-xylo-4-hexulose-3-dehydrase
MTAKSRALASIRVLVESYCDTHLDHSFDPSNPKVRLHEPTFGSEEIWEALESLLTTRITMGEKVRRFEREFGEHFSLPNALMVNSGSSANLLAVSALSNVVTSERLRPGDEVVVPALAWSTTVWPLIQNGLVPVIVDIDPDTLNLDPGEVERAIGEKTRGIVLVHVYGNPCDMSAIMDIVDRHSLTLVEDCCEALGAYYDGRSVGSFGQVGTFSFYFSHHITTLEGGMCVTGDEDLGETMRILRAHGWVRETRNKDRYTSDRPAIDPQFLFVNVGYNLRATELQGGFGYVQLGKLEGFVNIRANNAAYWRKELGALDEVFGFQHPTPRGTHSWFGFPMTVRESAPFSVVELTGFLNDRGIETRPIIAGNIAEQPAMDLYEHRVVGDLPHSSHVMKNGFTFGNHQAVDEAAREYVVGVVQDFLAERGIS